MSTAVYYHIRAGHEAPQLKLIDIFSEEIYPIYVSLYTSAPHSLINFLFSIKICGVLILPLLLLLLCVCGPVPQLKDQREPNDTRAVPRLRVIYKFIDTIFKVQKVRCPRCRSFIHQRALQAM